MADNIPVINAAGVTTVLRAVDQGNGTLVMMSVPSSVAGTALIGQGTIATSIPVNLPSNQIVSTLITNASLTTLISNAAVTTLISNASITALISNASLTALLAAGSNLVGNIKLADGTTGTTFVTVKAAGVAASTSDLAMVVAISPNGVNPNGGTSSANSAPVVIASDQTAIPTNLRVVGYTALPSSVANSTVLPMVGDKVGRAQVTFNPRELKASQTGSTATNAEVTIVNPVNATTFADIYGLTLANSGSTTTLVNIRYGTGSAVLYTIEVPATDTRGFMVTSADALPGSLTTANLSWTMTCVNTTVMSWSVFYVKNT